MPDFQADVHVTLKPLVNDPEGLVIRDALRTLGFAEVGGVRSGKYIQLQVTAADERVAEDQVRAMCEKLLANPVIEEYTLRVRQQVAG
jgi:phosphoribosylformylglycinamidine synthase PurS subunit